MANVSSGTYVVEGLKIDLNVLRTFSRLLPAPGLAIVNLAEDVITALRRVSVNRDVASCFQTDLLKCLPVVLSALYEHTIGHHDRPTIPSNVRINVSTVHLALNHIQTALSNNHFSATTQLRRTRAVKDLLVVTSKSSLVSDCAKYLGWAVSPFEITKNFVYAARLCNVSRIPHTTTFDDIPEKLPRANYAKFDSERPDRPSSCFKGTRVAVIKEILRWIVDPTIERFFWLSGLAGIGKTTVAHTVAYLAQSLGILGASFIFSRRGEAELRNPALVFPTIAYQLALFDPEFCRRITAALKSHPDAPYASLKQQRDHLLIEPLRGLDHDPERIVLFVLDACDECESVGAMTILQLLLDALPRLPFCLKIFVTGRPEEHIRAVLTPPNRKLRISILHDIEASVVKGDIELYLTARLRGLPKELGREELGEDWITPNQIMLLADAASNLFVHAETLIRFLSEARNLPKRLGDLLVIISSTRSNAPAGYHRVFFYLDQLYTQILLGIIAPTNEDEVTTLFQTVVGSIVLLRDPLPLLSLKSLADLDEGDAASLLSCLHSVILPPGPPDHCPRIYHPSFPDFLLDHARCTDDRLWIDAKVHEPRLALRCLKIMNKLLHKNMLGDFEFCPLNSEVANLADRVAAAIPLELQYACRFWASHLACVPHSASKEVVDSLADFASRALLPWLEVVSWIGQTRSAIPSLEAVNAWVAKSSCSAITISLLNDAYRLLLAHFPTITQSALHIARSVLPFAPRNISLTSTYATYADPNVRVIDGADLEWSACLMTIKGHTGDINSMAVSSDGTRIVSGSEDDTICIWDANTGDCMAVLESPSDGVLSVAFSPDGDRIISGAGNGTASLWDVTTGREVSKLEGHHHFVMSVSFSPNGACIASGSEDKTIIIWDAATYAALMTLMGHSAEVRSVAFFPDGKRLASGSRDNTVRVWDLEAGICISTLEHHFLWPNAMVISPNGLQIVSGSGHTLSIWDVSSGDCIDHLHGDEGIFTAVAFSPNGSHILSGSASSSVRLWDATTHVDVAAYNGHVTGIDSVAFSQDSRRIVSCSHDQRIKIWDASIVLEDASDVSQQTDSELEGIISLAFSSDKSRLAVLSLGPHCRCWVQILDSAMPKGPDILSFPFDKGEWTNEWVFRLRFSADDTQIIVTDDTRTFVYNASNGELKGIEGRTHIFDSERPPLVLEDGKLLQHDTSAPAAVPEVVSSTSSSESDTESVSNAATIICFMPPSLEVNDAASFEVDGEPVYRVLVGCRDGRIITLHIT